jgi:hypothetical protein
MGLIGFTTEDLANLKAALVSGALIVQIGDRTVKYRDQKDIIQAIRMVQQELEGIPSDSGTTVQAKFSKGSKGTGSNSGFGHD